MNFNQLIQQAQKMQRKVNKVKKEYEQKTFDFSSQQNLITGKMNGKLEIVELNIDDQLLSAENKEMLVDLLTVSLNDIINKVNEDKENTLNQITNGVDVSAFL